MNEDDIMQLLTDPSVNPDDKKKLLAHLQGQQQGSSAWPMTLAALGTDAVVGTAAGDMIDKKFSGFGPRLAGENTFLSRMGVKPHHVTNVTGNLVGAGIGLGGAAAYSALSHYLNPLQ